MMKLFATLLILAGQFLMPCEHVYFPERHVPVFSSRIRGGFMAVRIIKEKCINCGKIRWFGRQG